jgi:pimeloyl-ACP methyl ester carboxylesterase
MKMPYFEKENVKLYYEDVGKGVPIISNHGLSEDCNYWSESGVTEILVKAGYRFISIDMRAHGRTRPISQKEPKGYNADTMLGDFDALADFLKIEKFHLLSHATGGMVAARYGRKRSERLLSLILTDTSSNTAITMPEREDLTDDQKFQIAERAKKFAEVNNTPEKALAAWREIELTTTVEQRMEGIKNDGWPYLHIMAKNPDSERMLKIYEGFLRRQDRGEIVDFMRNFYTDPDPGIEELQRIKCPTLILLGEHDVVFLKPSELMAKEIPDVKHVILEGLGHMTAIEDPDRTAKEILDFLDTVKRTGKAK